MSAVRFLVSVCLLCAAASCAQHMVARMYSPTGDTELHEALLARSTPGSPLFRQHMTMHELKQHVSASDECINTVKNWIAAHNGKDTTVGVLGDNVFFALPVNLPVDASQSHVKYGKLSHAVPSELQACVRFLFSFTGKSPRYAKRGVDASSSSSGSSGFPGMHQSPPTILHRYQIPATTVDQAVGFSQGVAEFEGEQFYQSDIDTYNTRFSVPNNSIRVAGPNKGGYFDEGVMDLEIIQSIASGAETWWLAEREFDFTTWTEEVLKISPMPMVLSISWGSGESGYDNASMQSDSDDFRKLGLLGASVLCASGDQGTGSTGFLSCGTFDPTFPATSPYVTAVGGTYANSLADTEVSWSGSGGGFSTVFPAPSYQQAAIDAYVANATMPPSSLYTAGGRGIPDVAALACNFDVFANGWGVETGTSAATPTFAAVISRIVIDRLKAGKPTLGLLNPVLYRSGHSVGFDVTEGNNQVSGCPAGFSAAVGWDAISGLGTPLFRVLSELLSP